MSLLISASALMHIQQQFGDKAICTVLTNSKGFTICVDDGVKRLSREYPHNSGKTNEQSGDILMRFEKEAKRYFARSE